MSGFLWAGNILTSEDGTKDARYSNPELDTVTVLYTGEDDIIREWYIPVDEKDDQWNAFLKEVSYDELDTNTKRFNENFRDEFRKAFDDYAGRNYVIEKVVEKEIERIVTIREKGEDKEIAVMDMSFLIDDGSEQYKEMLFKFKLQIFETDEVKNAPSDDKTKLAKSYIRKAKTPVDVVVGYKMFDNDVKVTSTKEGVNVKIKN
jgi:hypothetical protein